MTTGFSRIGRRTLRNGSGDGDYGLGRNANRDEDAEEVEMLPVIMIGRAVP
jgi:hypothetical protein